MILVYAFLAIAALQLLLIGYDKLAILEHKITAKLFNKKVQ